eukprot:gene6218-7428_t
MHDMSPHPSTHAVLSLVVQVFNTVQFSLDVVEWSIGEDGLRKGLLSLTSLAGKTASNTRRSRPTGEVSALESVA